jgi:hypothetical protein
MTITLGLRSLIAVTLVVGLLAGMALSQIAQAGAGAQPEARASSSYGLYRQLQAINAKIGSNVRGSLAPVLANIETYAYNTCRAVEGHPLGHCE